MYSYHLPLYFDYTRRILAPRSHIFSSTIAGLPVHCRGVVLDIWRGNDSAWRPQSTVDHLQNRRHFVTPLKSFPDARARRHVQFTKMRTRPRAPLNFLGLAVIDLTIRQVTRRTHY